MTTDRSPFVNVIRTLAPILILGAGIGGFLVFGQRPEVPKREKPDDAALVETAEVAQFNGTFTIDVDGVAVPFRRVTLSAEVSGTIEHKESVSRSGHFVRQGDPLFRIDATDYHLEHQRLEAQHTQALEEVATADVDIANTRSQIELAQEELDLRNKELKRIRDLAARNAVSESNVDEARRLELGARTSLRTLQNQLESAEQRKKTLQAGLGLIDVQLKRAQVDVERTNIASPLSGTVVADHVEQGDYVRVGDPLIEILDARRMEVKCSLRADELYWVWAQSGLFAPGADLPNDARFEMPRTPVSVVYKFNGVEFVWNGVLSRYEGSGVDQSTRTVPCRVVVDDPTHVEVHNPSGVDLAASLPSLVSGLYVSVRIPIQPPVKLLEIPLAALRPGGQAWIVDRAGSRTAPSASRDQDKKVENLPDSTAGSRKDGKLAIQQVLVERTLEQTVLVRRQEGGLRPGDKVVTSPLSNAQTGMPVKMADDRNLSSTATPNSTKQQQPNTRRGSSANRQKTP